MSSWKTAMTPPPPPRSLLTWSVSSWLEVLLLSTAVSTGFSYDEETEEGQRLP